VRTRIDGGMLLDLTDDSLTNVSVLVDDGTGSILSIGTDLPAGDRTISLAGEILLPGFIDVHVHLREPGFEHKETIATGARAAAAGGFTQIACMPNTKPALDTPELISYVLSQAKAAGAANVLPIGCITKGQKGEMLTDFAKLKDAGAIALSDDGRGVQNGSLMREAMVEAAKLNLPIAIHSEDESIAGAGVLHKYAAARLSMPDIPGEAEAAMIARDILLAEQTGAHIHICHVSVESSIALVRFAKSRGVQVTCEVTPHHLLLTDEIITKDDGVYKVNPPLRSESDRIACLEAFLDGTIDMVATDHAPHAVEEKAKGILAAPFGMVGIETVFPLLYTHMVLSRKMKLSDLVRRMSTEPAHKFHLSGGVIRPGGRADLTAVNIREGHTIDPAKFYSMGHNTPFAGWQASGFSILTVCGGKVIHHEGGDAKWPQ
jgi:dihydroorotase